MVDPGQDCGVGGGCLRVRERVRKGYRAAVHVGGGAGDRLLRKVKKLDLSEAEKSSIQELILKRIDTKAFKNFRDICRLIPIVETEGLSNEIALRALSNAPSVKHRADVCRLIFSNSRQIARRRICDGLMPITIRVSN